MHGKTAIIWQRKHLIISSEVASLRKKHACRAGDAAFNACPQRSDSKFGGLLQHDDPRIACERAALDLDHAGCGGVLSGLVLCANAEIRRHTAIRSKFLDLIAGPSRRSLTTREYVWTFSYMHWTFSLVVVARSLLR